MHRGAVYPKAVGEALNALPGVVRRAQKPTVGFGQTNLPLAPWLGRARRLPSHVTAREALQGRSGV